jgi:hypothetical protein
LIPKGKHALSGQIIAMSFAFRHLQWMELTPIPLAVRVEEVEPFLRHVHLFPSALSAMTGWQTHTTMHAMQSEIV